MWSFLEPKFLWCLGAPPPKLLVLFIECRILVSFFSFSLIHVVLDDEIFNVIAQTINEIPLVFYNMSIYCTLNVLTLFAKTQFNPQIQSLLHFFLINKNKIYKF
jgi:hypothetical protein